MKVDFNIVENVYLSGNEGGYTTSPINLDELPYNDIKILANLSTNNPDISPQIDSISLIWQKDDETWRDQFSSTFRIDEIDNVIISNEQVKLILSVNDWPSFGKDSENTRSSDGFGPDVNNHSLYWYTTTTSGGQYKNSVIKNNLLYLPSLNGRKIYVYNATIPIGDEGSKIYPINQINITQNTIESTPALTDNDQIIVASGTTSNNGNIINKIYLLFIFPHNL